MLSCIHSTNIYQAPYCVPSTVLGTEYTPVNQAKLLHLSRFPFLLGEATEQVITAFKEYDSVCQPESTWLLATLCARSNPPK